MARKTAAQFNTKGAKVLLYGATGSRKTSNILYWADKNLPNWGIGIVTQELAGLKALQVLGAPMNEIPCEDIAPRKGDSALDLLCNGITGLAKEADVKAILVDNITKSMQHYVAEMIREAGDAGKLTFNHWGKLNSSFQKLNDAIETAVNVNGKHVIVTALEQEPVYKQVTKSNGEVTEVFMRSGGPFIKGNNWSWLPADFHLVARLYAGEEKMAAGKKEFKAGMFIRSKMTHDGKEVEWVAKSRVSPAIPSELPHQDTYKLLMEEPQQ